MADPKVRIPIELPPGDLSGALQATQEIDALKESAEQANEDVRRSAERIEEAFNKTEEGAKRADDGLKKLFDQQRLQGIGRQFEGLAQSVGAAAREFGKSDAGEEMFSGLSEATRVYGETALGIASGVARGYAEGGPIGAAIGGLIPLVDALSGGWLEMNQRVKASEAELEQAILANNARIRERKKEATGREIESTYQAERRELEAQRQELERISKIRESERSLAKAKDVLADAKAQAAGTPKAAIEIENVGQDFEAQRQIIREEMEAARANLQALGDELSNATKAYIDEVARVGTKAADQGETLKRVEAAKLATASAERDILALEEVLNNAEQTFAAEAETKLVQQGERLLGSLEASAGDLEAALQEGINNAKSDSSTAARAALEDVQRVIEDGVVKPEEVTALLQAVQRLQGSTEAKDSRVAEAIRQITENGTTYDRNLRDAISILKRQGNQLEANARELEQLKQRMAAYIGP